MNRNGGKHKEFRDSKGKFKRLPAQKRNKINPFCFFKFNNFLILVIDITKINHL